MWPVLQCVTVLSTALLSIADAHLVGEYGAYAPQTQWTPSWPGLSISVLFDHGRQYEIVAKPVVSVDQRSVRYNVYTGLGYDQDTELSSAVWIRSYGQTDGRVVTIAASSSRTAVCLQSESGVFTIPPINAIAEGLMSIQDAGVPTTSAGWYPKDYPFQADGSSYTARNVIPGTMIRITGVGMYMNVTYSNSVDVKPLNTSACEEVVKPTVVVEGFGKSLLCPQCGP